MRYLLLFLAVFGAVALHAQNGHSESSQRWQALQELQIPALAKKPARTSPKSAQEKAQERQELVAHYSTLAAAAKSFRESFPEDPNAKAALAIEADSLLKMAFLRDDTRAAYTDTLVSDIERDTTLPPRVRYRIVALSEYLLRRQTVRSSSEARAAWVCYFTLTADSSKFPLSKRSSILGVVHPLVATRLKFTVRRPSAPARATVLSPTTRLRIVSSASALRRVSPRMNAC